MVQDYRNNSRKTSPSKNVISPAKNRDYNFNVSKENGSTSPSNMRSASDLAGNPLHQQIMPKDGTAANPEEQLRKIKQSGMILGGYQSKSGHASLIIPGPVPPIDEKQFFSPQSKKGGIFD